MPDEGENIQLHIFNYADLPELLASGRLKNAPVIMALQWLQQKISDMEAARDEIPFGLDEDSRKTLAALRIALASLEAEPVAWLLSGGGAKNNVSFDSGNAYADPLREVTPLYTAPPAPVSVPAAMEMDDDFDSAFEHGKAVGWNAYRAAMLQGADRPQNEPQNIPENIPATQFKPVADLYGLTSPTGGETSFTFDAVEARDFIDGGWSCQEYVELGRYQEALTDHSEDKLAMVDHSGDSNNMVEPVTTAYKLPELRYLDTVKFNADCALQDPESIYANEFFLSLDEVFGEIGNYSEPVQAKAVSALIAEVFRLSGYSPAAPQQEVTQALAKGMERYGDAMQKLADSGD